MSREGPVLSYYDQRSPSSDLSPLTSLATSASVLIFTISPLLAQIPPHFMWRQNVCGLLWEAFHHKASKNCSLQKTLPLHCSPALGPLTAFVTSYSVTNASGLGVPCPGDFHSAPQEGRPSLSFSLQWFLSCHLLHWRGPATQEGLSRVSPVCI